MKRIYLKIIDVDQFDLTEISDEKTATHCVDVSDDDYASALEFIWRYFSRIEPYLPRDPHHMPPAEAQT